MTRDEKIKKYKIPTHKECQEDLLTEHINDTICPKQLMEKIRDYLYEYPDGKISIEQEFYDYYSPDRGEAYLRFKGKRPLSVQEQDILILQKELAIAEKAERARMKKERQEKRWAKMQKGVVARYKKSVNERTKKDAN